MITTFGDLKHFYVTTTLQNLGTSLYIHSSNLLALDTCKPAVGEYSPSKELPHHLPLKVEFWSQEWASHIDHGYVAYLLEGIANGS